MNEHVYVHKLNKALDRMGNIYKPSDIARCVDNGDLQCFVDGNSVAITQLNQFPNRRVVDILLAVGDLSDTLAIHDMIVNFAQEQRASLLRAQARPGWWPHAKKLGWRPVNVVYYKDL